MFIHVLCCLRSNCLPQLIPGEDDAKTYLHLEHRSVPQMVAYPTSICLQYCALPVLHPLPQKVWGEITVELFQV